MKISKIVLSAAIAATMAAATAAVASAETAEVTGEVVAISTDSTAEAVATTAEAETTVEAAPLTLLLLRPPLRQRPLRSLLPLMTPRALLRPALLALLA